VDRGEEERDWTFAAWDWLLRNELGLPSTEPAWLNRPAMMQITMSTPHVLKCLNKMGRPYNFVLCPLIDGVVGYPAGIDREQFTLIRPFTKNRNSWLSGDYVNIYDGNHYSLSLTQTPKFDKVIPQTFGYILRLYLLHPESKSLAPDGTPCGANTHGLLQRMHVIAAQPRYIGKETDRKWEQGGDLSLLQFKPAQFDELGKMAKADPALIEQIAAVPIKALVRKANVDRNTIRKMLRGVPVRRATIQRVAAALAQVCAQRNVGGSERQPVVFPDASSRLGSQLPDRERVRRNVTAQSPCRLTQMVNRFRPSLSHHRGYHPIHHPAPGAGCACRLLCR
jgi:hypothetical protein